MLLAEDITQVADSFIWADYHVSAGAPFPRELVACSFIEM